MLPKILIPNSLEGLEFDLSKPVFCDIETEALYVNTRLVQLYQPSTNDGQIIILDTDIIDLEDIKKFIAPLWTVWYNASYDFGTLNMTTKVFDDLYYLSKMAYPLFMEYNLDKVISKLGFDYLYEGLNKKNLQKMGFVKGAYLSQHQITYSATDVYALSLIWEFEDIQKQREVMAYKVDILSMKYAIQYQQNGLLVDEITRDLMLIETEKEVSKLMEDLPEGFNPNSFKQVRAYLGTDKSDYDTLVKYASSNSPLAHKATVIIKVKKGLKEISYLKSIMYPKMITKFNVAGAITGRFSSSGGDIPNGFNSQQIPRRFQPLFKADMNGTKVVGLDYSTLELRIAAAVFGEDVMYEELKRGEDLHTNMASLATGKIVHPEKGLLGSEYDSILTGEFNGEKYLTKTDRTKAKAINFGYVYGMSAATYQNYSFVSYGVPCSMEEATRLRYLYFKKYKKIKAYHEYVWKNYTRHDFTYTTALGRRVKPKMGTDGINGPIQGSGGETTKLAVHYLVKEYPEALNYLFNVVHDAIYLRVPEDQYDLWRERLRVAMIRGWTEISKTSIFKFKDIPMPVGD